MAEATAPFGDTSEQPAEDHAAANAERERDLAAPPGGRLSRAYSVGYLEGLEDGTASVERLDAARRAGRRRAVRLAVAAGVAWLVGSAVGDTLGALVRWVDG